MNLLQLKVLIEDAVKKAEVPEAVSVEIEYKDRKYDPSNIVLDQVISYVEGNEVCIKDKRASGSLVFKLVIPEPHEIYQGR